MPLLLSFSADAAATAISPPFSRRHTSVIFIRFFVAASDALMQTKDARYARCRAADKHHQTIHVPMRGCARYAAARSNALRVAL